MATEQIHTYCAMCLLRHVRVPLRRPGNRRGWQIHQGHRRS
jgi:hypothetical protein